MCALLLCVEYLRATQFRSMRGEMDRACDLRCIVWSNCESEPTLQLSGLSSTSCSTMCEDLFMASMSWSGSEVEEE